MFYEEREDGITTWHVYWLLLTLYDNCLLYCPLHITGIQIVSGLKHQKRTYRSGESVHVPSVIEVLGRVVWLTACTGITYLKLLYAHMLDISTCIIPFSSLSLSPSPPLSLSCTCAHTHTHTHTHTHICWLSSLWSSQSSQVRSRRGLASQCQQRQVLPVTLGSTRVVLSGWISSQCDINTLCVCHWTVVCGVVCVLHDVLLRLTITASLIGVYTWLSAMYIL